MLITTHLLWQQSITTRSILKLSQWSFLIAKEFINDSWIVDHCKEFTAPFIYLSCCGQMSYCDHRSHTLDDLWFALTQIPAPLPCDSGVHSARAPVYLGATWLLFTSQHFQHQSVCKTLPPFHVHLPVKKILYSHAKEWSSSRKWVPLGHGGKPLHRYRNNKAILCNVHCLLCLLKHTRVYYISHIS